MKLFGFLSVDLIATVETGRQGTRQVENHAGSYWPVHLAGLRSTKNKFFNFHPFTYCTLCVLLSCNAFCVVISDFVDMHEKRISWKSPFPFAVRFSSGFG